MHTPGPWHFAADADGTMTTNGNGAQIAMWPPQGGTIEQCANARLIAAAPELLERLTHLLVFCDHLRGSAVYNDARAAIAAATED